MGHKIITEEDFWICSEGAIPTPFQGTRSSNKTPDGKVYITVEDTSTVSWIDFGCKKYMFLAAIIAAAAVVVAVAVGILTVATGGMGLVMLGAIAGVAGGVIGAVMGGLLCGQKMGGARKWLGSKSNFISTGAKTITGEHQMECKAGGVIKYAPNIKSWLGAFGYAGLSYGNELVKCAFTGMGIVSLTPFIIGGSVAGTIGGGGFTLTRASMRFAWPTFKSVGSNVLSSFGIGTGSTWLGGGILGARVLSGAESASNTYAMAEVDENGNSISVADSFAKGALPEYEFVSRVKEQGISGLQWTDAMFLLYFLNAKADPPGTYRDKNGKLRNTRNNPRGQKPGSFAQDPRRTKTGKGKGKAYEQGIEVIIAQRKQTAIDFYKKHNPEMDILDIESHINGIDFTKPVNVKQISEGKELIQYTKVNTEGEVLRGDYYTTDLNAKPNELGVSETYNVRDSNNGWKQTQEVRTVNKEITTIPNNAEGLQSTAAPIEDTWSRIDPNGNQIPIPTEGGGSQIYIPKSQFKK